MHAQSDRKQLSLDLFCTRALRHPDRHTTVARSTIVFLFVLYYLTALAYGAEHLYICQTSLTVRFVPFRSATFITLPEKNSKYLRDTQDDVCDLKDLSEVLSTRRGFC
jgi:hypothetical protein